jgi:hypothetical protein
MLVTIGTFTYFFYLLIDCDNHEGKNYQPTRIMGGEKLRGLGGTERKAFQLLTRIGTTLVSDGSWQAEHDHISHLLLRMCLKLHGHQCLEMS